MSRRPAYLFGALAAFAAAAGFYFATATYVPFPGQSSEWLAALCFPGQFDTTAYPIDAVVGRWIVALTPPEALMTVMTAVSAVVGALLVMMFFRMAISGVRFCCQDFTGIRKDEEARARSDVRLIIWLTGFGAALFGLAALPVWAIGTRPLPGALTILLCCSLLAFAMHVRQYAAALLDISGPWPTARLGARLFLVFALATWVGLVSLPLIPVSILSIALAGRVLIRHDTEERLALILWVVVALVAGVGLSMATVSIWQSLFCAEPHLAMPVLWAKRLQAGVPQLLALFQTLEGGRALAAFALVSVLLIGNFPIAYLRFGTPLVGQLAIVALVGLGCARFPASYWDGMTEPPVLDAVAIYLTVATFGLTVGSWVRNWLDVNSHRPERQAHRLALLLAAAVFLPLTLIVALQDWRDGSGLLAREAMSQPETSAGLAVPEGVCAWLNPPAPQATSLVFRYLSGEPFQVVQSPLDLDCSDVPEADCALLAELREIGPAPLLVQLNHSAFAGKLLSGDLPEAEAFKRAALAEALARTSFSETAPGRRFLESLRMDAARALVDRAEGEPDAEALSMLREALALNPGNRSAWLGLRALPDGLITDDEYVAAESLCDHAPWLREPTVAQARTVDLADGRVRSPLFASARRVWGVIREAKTAEYERLLALYREAPAMLSEEERIFAAVALPEEEVGRMLLAREASEDELEAYLCAYPESETSEALYEQNRERLERNQGLAWLCQGKGRVIGDRRAAKALAFFRSEHRFAYAMLYVKILLADGKLDEAREFVTGFNAVENLSSSPLLFEWLLERILTAVAAKDPVEAASLARGWLRANPQQPFLWEYLFGHLAWTEVDLRNCLAVFPLHIEATERYAGLLREKLGDEAAQRYAAAVESARAGE